MIKSTICELLGIRYPVFQGGMAWIADGKLAAAVSGGHVGELTTMVLVPQVCDATSIPLYSNVTAQPYGDVSAQLLARQIESPVQWERLVQNLIASGVDTFVEIGPGKTLTNMIKRIDPAVRACGYGEYLEELPC